MDPAQKAYSPKGIKIQGIYYRGRKLYKRFSHEDFQVFDDNQWNTLMKVLEWELKRRYIFGYCQKRPIWLVGYNEQVILS